MYHRIGSTIAGDPWEMTVSPENFELQVQQVALTRTPFPISEFVDRLVLNTLPDDAIAITFDDAYHDNLKLAKPILDRYRVPATIFVAPAFLDKAVFWWDKLQHIVWTSPRIPASIRIELEGRLIDFVFDAEDRRAQALSTLWAAMRDLEPACREEAIDRIGERLDARSVQCDFRPMTRGELKEVASGDVEIGAHTVNHAWLPALEPAAKRREILDSLTLCKELVGYAPRCFSYPYGAFDADTREIVREAGFLGACTVSAALVSPGCDRLALPRIAAPNDLQRFQQAICHAT